VRGEKADIEEALRKALLQIRDMEADSDALKSADAGDLKSVQDEKAEVEEALRKALVQVHGLQAAVEALKGIGEGTSLQGYLAHKKQPPPWTLQ